MAKSWHAVFQALRAARARLRCLIIQRTLTAVVGIAVLLAGGGLVAAACGLPRRRARRPRRGRVLLPALDARARAPRPTRAGGVELLRGGFRSASPALLFVLLLKVDVLLLSFLTANAEVGLYAAAYRLIEGTQFIPWAFNAAMLPWLARARRAGAGPRLHARPEAAWPRCCCPPG